MIFVLLGPPSPVRALCMDAIARLLAAVAGGSAGQQLENARDPDRLATEPEAVYAVIGGAIRDFDFKQYLANNADLRPDHGNASAATTHFAHYGWREGRPWLVPGMPGHDHLVIGTETPEEHVLKGWMGAVHGAVALDDPVAIGRAIVANSSCTRREAIRRVSASFATLHDQALDKATPLLVPSDAAYLARQLGRLLQPCAINGDVPWLEAWLKHVLADGWLPWAVPAQNAYPAPALQMADLDDATLAAVLESFGELLAPRPVDAVVWPAAIFQRADDPLIPPDEIIDLSGPARGLLIGPHLCLPAGKWRCEGTFRVAENRRGCRFIVDIYQRGAVNRALAAHDFTLPEEGTFVLQLPFETMSSSPSAAIENRWALHEGVIGGEFQLMEVKLVRE